MWYYAICRIGQGSEWSSSYPSEQVCSGERALQVCGPVLVTCCLCEDDCVVLVGVVVFCLGTVSLIFYQRDTG